MVKSGKHIDAVKRNQLFYCVLIVEESFHFAQRSFSTFLIRIVKETYFFMGTVLIFLFFLAKNGSLVLGDKAAHEAVIHIPQICYFSLFTFVFAFPHCVHPLLQLPKTNRTTKIALILAIITVALIVHLNTMVHLYLIFDNRHYTFYLWKRIYEKPFGKFIFVPIYVISIYSIIKNLSHLDGCTKLAYLISTTLCLIPHKLLELRYFIVPYMLYNIEMSFKITSWQLIFQLMFNVAINCIAIYLFLWSPFEWSDGTVQRFSW